MPDSLIYLDHYMADKYRQSHQCHMSVDDLFEAQARYYLHNTKSS